MGRETAAVAFPGHCESRLENRDAKQLPQDRGPGERLQAPFCARYAMSAERPSAADLKFLQRLQQTRLGTSNRKAALES